MRDWNPFNQISEEIKKIEASFGGKKYSDVQLQIIHEHGDKVPIAVFRSVCKDLIGSSRYKPLPVDFKKSLMPHHEKANTEQADEEYKMNCESCQDTGLCLIRTEFDILVKCHCERGIARTEIFPQLDKHDPRDKFPVELFKPEADTKTGNVDIAAKVKWWVDMLDISKGYWKAKMEEGAK